MLICARTPGLHLRSPGFAEYPGAFRNGRPSCSDILHERNFAASDFLGSPPGEGSAHIFAPPMAAEAELRMPVAGSRDGLVKRPVGATAERASTSPIVIGQRIGR